MTRPIRLLLVEDNPGDVELIKEILDESLQNFEITALADGAEALEYLLHRRLNDRSVNPLPDLMLLDLNLPRVSGHAVLKALRASDTARTLPVIVVTSSDATHDIETSYALGANCYLTKPGDLGALRSVILAVAEFWLGVVKLPRM
jgi:CheY-like chemotaxis protein